VYGVIFTTGFDYENHVTWNVCAASHSWGLRLRVDNNAVVASLIWIASGVWRQPGTRHGDYYPRQPWPTGDAGAKASAEDDRSVRIDLEGRLAALYNRS
jgi:hypothetical protein